MQDIQEIPVAIGRSAGHLLHCYDVKFKLDPIGQYSQVCEDWL